MKAIQQVDISSIAGALWKIRRTPFLGKMLVASGMNQRGAFFVILCLALSFFFLPSAGSSIAWKFGLSLEVGIMLGVFLSVVSYVVILLLGISLWGTIQLQRELSLKSLGDFKKWMRSFFGPKSRIPLQWPEATLSLVWVIVVFIVALLLGLVGLVIFSAAVLMMSPLLFILGAAILSLHVFIKRHFRRLVAVPSSKVLVSDKRPPILFLRSFNDDGLSMKPGFFSMSYGKSLRFEEQLALSVWREGPVVAIGKPGERLPEFGACREYHTDDTWQQRILELMEQAGGVCMLVGVTDALGWEIHQLLENEVISKSVFVLPPLPAEQVSERLKKFSGLMPDFDFNAADPKLPCRALCLVFDDQSRPIVFTSRRRIASVYPVAMHAAFVCLSSGHAHRLPGSELESALVAEMPLRRVFALTALFLLPALIVLSYLFPPDLNNPTESDTFISEGSQTVDESEASENWEVSEEPANVSIKAWTGAEHPYLLTTPLNWIEMPSPGAEFDLYLSAPFGAAICTMDVTDHADLPIPVTTQEEAVELVEFILEFSEMTEISVIPLDTQEINGDRWFRVRSDFISQNGVPCVQLRSMCWREKKLYSLVAGSIKNRYEEFEPELFAILNGVTFTD
ncbi:MAG: hypothetical protein ABJQ29_08730 [Luteolibacter sp.]